MEIFETNRLKGLPEELKAVPYHGSDEEMSQMRFRVACLGYSSNSLSYCGHGTGMTINEMNANLRREGRSEIAIPYCKHCYQERTPGFLDDNPTFLGLHLSFPEEHPSKQFVLERMDSDWIDRLNRG